MAARFAIWDMETGNLVAAYDSEDAALRLLADSLTQHGATYVASLALVREDQRGRLRVLADGTALVERARAALESRRSSTPRSHAV